MRTPKANDYVDLMLRQGNDDLAKRFDAHILIVRAPIRIGLDGVIRDVVEGVCENSARKTKNLVVLLETGGGFIEVVERIYGVFRKHYDRVDFIVPNYAYSAGTVLVLSGDTIYMDYYSVLGPIDPQIENNDGKSVPGLGCLAKFDELAKKINSDKTGGAATRAELAYLVKKFDPAVLFLLEQAKNHSRSLLIQWLSSHKFKDWTKTDGNGNNVTEAMRKERASQIADILGNAERWHSHGRGIGLKELTSEEIKLKIVDFGQDAELNRQVRSYYDLFIDYCRITGTNSAIHSEQGLRRIQ